MRTILAIIFMTFVTQASAQEPFNTNEMRAWYPFCKAISDGRATSLGIMTQGPLGSSDFSNEFGRPTVCGYFRSFEEYYDGQYWGFHKPIMFAGGVGLIGRENIKKGRRI